MPTPTTADDFDGDFAGFLEGYKYQPNLTACLDGLCGTEFTQAVINEIVLWKVDRFVELGDELLHEIESLKLLNPGEHLKASPLLESLLQVRGIDLPMASTLMRFRNPGVFQIIDRHAYRAVYGLKYPLYTSSSLTKKIGVYFDFLDEIIKLCSRKLLKFETVDRVLYQFDKAKNGTL